MPIKRATRGINSIIMLWGRSWYGGKMKVYITYEKDGFGGLKVEKVFSCRSDATSHIINNFFGSNEYYTSRTRIENEVMASDFIEEHEVV